MNPEFINGYNAYWYNELGFPIDKSLPFQLGWRAAANENELGEYKETKYSPVIGANPWLGVPIELVY